MSSAFSADQRLVAITVLITVAAAVRGTWSPCGLSMISAINAFTERSRGHRYGMTACWFVTGSVIGGALLGTAGAVGHLVLLPLGLHPAAVAAAATMCCLVTLAGDSPAVGWRLPLIPRQVNERWLTGYRRWVYASGFGMQIGVGLATYVMTGAVYLVPFLGALSGSATFALGVGVLFGLVRGLAILLGSRANGPGQLRAVHRRLAALEPWSLLAAMLVQAGAAVGFGAAAGGGRWAALVGAVVLLVGVPGIRQQTRRRRAAAAGSLT